MYDEMNGAISGTFGRLRRRASWKDTFHCSKRANWEVLLFFEGATIRWLFRSRFGAVRHCCRYFNGTSHHRGFIWGASHTRGLMSNGSVKLSPWTSVHLTRI